MEKYLKLIKKSKLFFGLNENEILSILNCLRAYVKFYKKGENIFNTGDKIDSMPLILKGVVYLEKVDFFGNKTIFSEIYEYDIFGAYYYNDSELSPFNIISATDTIILFLDTRKLLNINSSCCNLNMIVCKNFISIILNKNKIMTKKIQHISQRTIRNKILSYLSEQSFKNNSNCFYINFNRQQLSDYLCIDRSSMSKELSKMQDEGILKFKKNYFELNKNFNFDI